LALIDAENWAWTQARLTANRRTVVPAELHGNRGAQLGAVRRSQWAPSGLVRCGLCNGPLSVMGGNGRLGCASHVERGTCTNRRTILCGALLPRVRVGLKERLLAPELVEIDCAFGSNSRATSCGVRLDRTNATICRRNSDGSGTLNLGISDTSVSSLGVSTKPGQIQS